ncbi:TPA: hypothetical protein ACNG7R_005534, partial [Klebsiella pneumoniae]|nr:hypothetical protein [Klebsiella pneumoniae]
VSARILIHISLSSRTTPSVEEIKNQPISEDSCLTLTDAPMKAKRMRSQSASVETNLSEAFDAIVCVPSAGKDGLVDL